MWWKTSTIQIDRSSLSSLLINKIKNFTSFATQELLVVDKSEPHALHGVQWQAVSVSIAAIDEDAFVGKVEHIDYGMRGEERCQLACQCDHEKYEWKRRK